MSEDFATIQFLPVCSNCGRIIYDIIDITEVPLVKGIATIPHNVIEPRQCKRCGAIFRQIDVPNRFPFNNKKEFSIPE